MPLPTRMALSHQFSGFPTVFSAGDYCRESVHFPGGHVKINAVAAWLDFSHPVSTNAMDAFRVGMPRSGATGALRLTLGRR